MFHRLSRVRESRREGRGGGCAGGDAVRPRLWLAAAVRSRLRAADRRRAAGAAEPDHRDGGDDFGTDRKSVVLGKSVSVRVDLGGRLIIKKKNTIRTH